MASLAERMVGAMKADVKTFEEIEQDPNALGQAIVVIVIAGVAAMLGNIFRFGIGAGVAGLVMTLVGYAIWTVLVVVIGTKLMPEPATRANFVEGFRVIGFAAAPGVFNVLAIVPFFGRLVSFFVALWMLVIMVVAVRSVLDYTSTARAVVVCLIGCAIYFGFYFFLIVGMFLANPF